MTSTERVPPEATAGILDPEESGDAGGQCDRCFPPPVLLPADLAAILDLPTPRAAREFVARHGVPNIRLGGRVYVRLESLLAFLESREAVPPTEEEARDRAVEDLRRIAPSRRAAQTGRKQARRVGGKPLMRRDP